MTRSTRPTARRITAGRSLTALGAVCLLTAASGCGSSSTTQTAASPTTAAPAATTATTAASMSHAETTAAGTGDAASGMGGEACKGADLTTSTKGKGGTGESTITITFTNKGKAPCTLEGFAEVGSHSMKAGDVGGPATHDEMKPATEVTLAPGAAAHALVTLQAADKVTGCTKTTAEHLHVTVPGDSAPITVNAEHDRCATGQKLTVSAFMAGAEHHD